MNEQTIRNDYKTAKNKVDTARTEFSTARSQFIRMDMCRTVADAMKTVGDKRPNESELDWGNRLAKCIESKGYKFQKRGPWGTT